MLHPKDNIGAFQAAVEWAEALRKREIQGWFASADRNQDFGYSPSIGFVKYGFTHAFRHLKASKDKFSKGVNGLYHEILNEPEKEEVRDLIIDWILERSG